MIATKGQQYPSLNHIGLAYNQLTDEALPLIKQSFPKLFCLDISHNRIESITQALRVFLVMNELKMLYLIGNPLMLAPNYRNVVKTKL